MAGEWLAATVPRVMECESEWAGANTKVNSSSGPPALCVLVLETRLDWGLIDRDIRVDSSTELNGIWEMGGGGGAGRT